MSNELKLRRSYTLGEEIFNSVSHGVGALGAVVAMVIMIMFSYYYGNTMSVVAAIIYGISMIVLYVMSTLYHSFTSTRVKGIFRIFDHCSIFILIAGTYTPFTLISLAGKLGYSMFAVVWVVAITGIVLNSISIERFEKLSMILYVLLGWVIVFAIKPLMASLETGGLMLLVLGGLLYTLGIIFYKLHKYKYMHSIWHLFVLGGSILHFFSILFYVLPVA